MRFVFLGCFIFLTACAGLKRGPSSTKNSDSIFNLINSEEVLKSGYGFELVNLFALNEKKVQFKTYDITAAEAKKAVESWQADLSGYLSVYKDDVSVRAGSRLVPVKIRDLTRLQQALTLLNKSGEPAERVLRKQVELISAFNQNFKLPESFNYAGSSIPFEFSLDATGKSSFSDSSFWQYSERKRSLGIIEASPENIFNRDCRAEALDLISAAKVICGNAQFTLHPQNAPKVAALNSILYRRFGYNSAPVIFAAEVPVAYERSILPLLIKLNVRMNAVLKSGDTVPFDAFISKLIPYCKSRNESCFSASALFDPNVENQLEKLVLSDVALNVDSGDHVFGPWAFEELDHRFRPEVKGLFFISAFTGNMDLRKDSNAVVWSAKNFTVTHQIQNLQSGLGAARPNAPMNLNGFKWEVLKTKKQKGSTVVVFDGYRPSIKHQALSEITADDAKWAIRQIAGLSEQELTEALALSGFSAAELLLAREKLLSIQKNFVQTLGLEKEFKSIAERKIEKNINYRLTGQPAIFEITSNRRIPVPERDDELVNGILKKGLQPLLENKRKISNTVDE
ncbi:MAG: hypothetical protein K0R29_60 [Pseudobdellovibrio sp.]|nr:hypothetical protein [Pseudobdellovibrio sp.]